MDHARIVTANQKNPPLRWTGGLCLRINCWAGFASAGEVRRIVASRKKEIGYDGALILSPTHILEPEVPVENVVAFVESCRE